MRRGVPVPGSGSSRSLAGNSGAGVSWWVIGRSQRRSADAPMRGLRGCCCGRVGSAVVHRPAHRDAGRIAVHDGAA